MTPLALIHLQNSSLASVIVGIIQVLFTAAAALVMDRAGRKLLLTLSGELPSLPLSPAFGSPYCPHDTP